MKKMNKVAITAAVIGMVCALAAGNTNTLLANGFLMVTIALVATKN